MRIQYGIQIKSKYCFYLGNNIFGQIDLQMIDTAIIFMRSPIILKNVCKYVNTGKAPREDADRFRDHTKCR